MSKKFYYVPFLICITLSILVTGCNSKENKNVPSNTSVSTPNNKLTIDGIKQIYANSDEKIVSTQEYKSYVLVESQAPSLANHFTFYDLNTGDKDVLPNSTNIIDSVKIVDENHIILYAKGTNSESVQQVFPFELDCTRTAANNNSENDFIPVFKESKMPIDKQISLKGKEKEEIKNIRVTMNGLQVSFGPQKGYEVGFNSDYLDSPAADISYDKTTGQFAIKFQDTVFAKSFSQISSQLQSNTYIKFLSFKENEGSAIITVKLNDTAKFYIGKKASIDAGIPYMDIQFFNNTES